MKFGEGTLTLGKNGKQKYGFWLGDKYKKK
jgi:hypothetical protein